VTADPFDAGSTGARRLARDWVPHLERWEMRVPDGHTFIEDDGRIIRSGQTIEVAARRGRQLVDRGYDLVSTRRAHRDE
jgi:hypothetical protein